MRKAICARPPRRDGERRPRWSRLWRPYAVGDHGGHRELFSVVSRLVTETNDRELRYQFGLAGQLHTNFYEGWLDRATVEDVLGQVARFG